MKVIYYFLIFMLQFLLLCQLSYAANDRYALVIGNSSYEGSVLKNPVNDAHLMTKTLKSLNFKVTELIDVDIRAMDEAVIDFGHELTKGGAGLFYFAGHGIQYQGKNYLIPLNTNIIKETDLKYEAFNANKVFDEMGYADNGLNIVILDACRDNPLMRNFRRAKRGLAETVDAPGGLLLAYSTSPGKQAADGAGENSPYTVHLVSAMKKEGLPLELVFKDVIKNVKTETNGQQVPWVSSSVDADFYFTKPKKTAHTQSTNNNKISQNDDRAENHNEAQFELMYWESVSKNPSKDKYQSYLKKYPDGHFKEIAESEMKQLEQKTIQLQTQTQSYPATDSYVRSVDASSAAVFEDKIKTCENHLSAYRLSSGTKGNAFDCYQRILKHDPDNMDALAGLTKIENAYIQLINKSINNDNSEKARRYIGRLEFINPQNKMLPRLKKAVIAKRDNRLDSSNRDRATPTPAPAPAPAPAPNIPASNVIPEEQQIFDEYVEIVAEMLEGNSLDDRQRSKVKQYLLKLREINSSGSDYLSLERKFYARYPDNYQVKKISVNEQQMFDEYLEVIDEMLEEKSLSEKQIKKLDKYFDKLNTIDPQSPEVIRVKKEYSKIKGR